MGDANECRLWEGLPDEILGSIAALLSPPDLASARLVCAQFRDACCLGTTKADLRVLPRHDLDRLKKVLPSLRSASLLLPMHDAGAWGKDGQATAGLAAQALLSDLARCLQLTELDLGMRAHLAHEPLLRRNCDKPVLASAVPLLPVLVRLCGVGGAEGSGRVAGEALPAGMGAGEPAGPGELGAGDAHATGDSAEGTGQQQQAQGQHQGQGQTQQQAQQQGQGQRQELGQQQAHEQQQQQAQGQQAQGQQQQQQQQPQGQQQQHPPLRLCRLALAYDSHTTSRRTYTRRHFCADLAQLTCLVSLTLQLRGGFTEDEASAVVRLPLLETLEIVSMTLSTLSARTMQTDRLTRQFHPLPKPPRVPPPVLNQLRVFPGLTRVTGAPRGPPRPSLPLWRPVTAPRALAPLPGKRGTLASATSPLKTLRLGPCTLNPSPAILGMLGSLPHLAHLSAHVSCASPNTHFSEDSLAVRCGLYDVDCLTGLSTLKLVLEGFSEARCACAAAAVLPSLQGLDLVLRGAWVPGWEGAEAAAQQAAQLRQGPGGQQEQGQQLGQQQQGQGQQQQQQRGPLTRFSLRDERSDEEAAGHAAHAAAAGVPTVDIPQGAWGGGAGGAAALAHHHHPALLVEEPHDAAHAAAAGGAGAGAGAGSAASGEAARSGLLLLRGGMQPPSPLRGVLAAALTPALREIELCLKPSFGVLSLDALAALCPVLTSLRVAGAWEAWLAPHRHDAGGGTDNTGSASAAADADGAPGSRVSGVGAARGSCFAASRSGCAGGGGVVDTGDGDAPGSPISSSRVPAARSTRGRPFPHLTELQLSYTRQAPSQQQLAEQRRLDRQLVDLALLPPSLCRLGLHGCRIVDSARRDAGGSGDDGDGGGGDSAGGGVAAGGSAVGGDGAGGGVAAGGSAVGGGSGGGGGRGSIRAGRAAGGGTSASGAGAVPNGNGDGGGGSDGGTLRWPRLSHLSLVACGGDVRASCFACCELTRLEVRRSVAAHSQETGLLLLPATCVCGKREVEEVRAQREERLREWEREQLREKQQRDRVWDEFEEKLQQEGRHPPRGVCNVPTWEERLQQEQREKPAMALPRTWHGLTRLQLDCAQRLLGGCLVSVCAQLADLRSLTNLTLTLHGGGRDRPRGFYTHPVLWTSLLAGLPARVRVLRLHLDCPPLGPVTDAEKTCMLQLVCRSDTLRELRLSGPVGFGGGHLEEGTLQWLQQQMPYTLIDAECGDVQQLAG
ncbi:hypothetical protein FOA52_012996 [Chlamydomonas sp. UWO 241]|nr:hypothetical protein FOA52_012996 [Chlamydomonas sp. UWO 241]